MTTLVVAGPAGISEHDGGPHHPEQQSRLFAVMDGVRALGLEDERGVAGGPRGVAR